MNGFLFVRADDVVVNWINENKGLSTDVPEATLFSANIPIWIISKNKLITVHLLI